MTPHAAGDSQGCIEIRGDGSVLHFRGIPGASDCRLTSVICRPLWPTLPQIWAPVVVGISITLLVAAILPAGAVPRSRPHQSKCDSMHNGGVIRSCSAARGVTILMALVGLNLSAAIFPAPLDCYDTERSDLPLAVLAGILDRNKQGTGVYRTDGSVTSYCLPAGQMRSQPTVIRPPMYSLLRLWGPVLFSASVTLLVVILLRRSDGQGSAPGKELERAGTGSGAGNVPPDRPKGSPSPRGDVSGDTPRPRPGRGGRGWVGRGGIGCSPGGLGGGPSRGRG
ncbi:hypothetical protein OJF2_40690 [Aquisphaera giovannonii]|uniref:Uncharacterized protein n=1 Tax=Aquisphaera giovannonii TaxID=406548 RepID=A0A5B9W5D6_9BACT|nr:hypothetical protein OJF2_40690 [Aquisphaera giovannonii]